MAAHQDGLVYKTLFKSNLIFLFFLLISGMVYIILDGTLVDFAFSKSVYGYSILLFLFSFFLISLIIYKSKTFPPSIVLFLFFLVFAIVGPAGAQTYYDLFGPYHGKYFIKSEYPLFIWTVGTVFLLLGILFSYFIIRRPKGNSIVQWDLKRASFFLWLTLGVAFVSTAFVLFKIGYIPILKSNIDTERVSYSLIAGEYPVKLSRLWFVAASISSMFIYLKSNRKLFLAITVVSLLGLTILGQRNYLFVGVSYYALIYCKFKRMKIRYIAYSAVFLVALLVFAEHRSGRQMGELTLTKLITINAAREWREYAIVVDDIRGTNKYYGKDIFIGALIPVLPKEIWSVLGVNKEYVIHKYGANFIFGEQFNDPIGIRITTIGEAYAGYGIYYGVCLQMFIFGIIFGVLENVYLRLDKTDARLCLVCFLMSLLMWLPIATLYIIIAYGIFFGFFLVIFYIMGTNRVVV